jgi:L-threonylcarbamoyladenylate synthase
VTPGTPLVSNSTRNDRARRTPAAAGAAPAALVAQAAALLRAGGLVCFPTETTYGLAVDIRLPGALARLVALKGRDPRSPFALIAPGVAAARALAAPWPAAAEALASAHWPGALTLVLPARPDLPAEIVGPGGGVGVRVSSHPWASALAAAVGGCITATSANPAGAPPAEDADAARAYFGDRVDLYLDAGACPGGPASTVVAVQPDGSLRTLRAGAVQLPG